MNMIPLAENKVAATMAITLAAMAGFLFSFFYLTAVNSQPKFIPAKPPIVARVMFNSLFMN